MHMEAVKLFPFSFCFDFSLHNTFEFQKKRRLGYIAFISIDSKPINKLSCCCKEAWMLGLFGSLTEDAAWQQVGLDQLLLKPSRTQEQPSTKATKCDLHSIELQISTVKPHQSQNCSPTCHPAAQKSSITPSPTRSTYSHRHSEMIQAHTLCIIFKKQLVAALMVRTGTVSDCSWQSTSTCVSPVGASPTECQAPLALGTEEQDRPSDLHWFSTSSPMIRTRSCNITLLY